MATGLANHIGLALMWTHGRLSTAGPPQMTDGPLRMCVFFFGYIAKTFSRTEGHLFCLLGRSFIIFERNLSIIE